MRPAVLFSFNSLLMFLLHRTWFQGTVPHIAAMKTSAVSAMSGKVKHSGLEENLGGDLVTSRTSRHEFGLFSQPTAGSANVTMGSGTYS